MLSCKKATELIEKKQVAPLTAIEGFQLNLHTSMCKACNAYQSQSGIIDKMMENFHRSPSSDSTEKLSEDTKKKIVDQLKK